MDGTGDGSGRQDRQLAASTLARILDVTRQLAAPFDLQTLLVQVIDAGRAILGAERGSVFLYDDASDELYSLVATGAESLRFPANRGIVGEAALKRRTINVADCYADPRFNQEIDRRTGYRTRCLLTVPLIGYDDALVGVMQLLNKQDGTFRERDESVAEALAAQCAVALQRVRMTEQLIRQEKLDQELALAREIQIGLLARSMPRTKGYDVFGLSVPADETGGDTFDLIPLGDERLMLLLGDATGHGIGPALSVTQVRSMLRVGLRLGADLDSIFRQINDQLVEDLADNRFVTAFIGLLDVVDHQVRYHSGGQAPLLHFHAATGECEWLGSTTMPLGFIDQVALKEAQTIHFEPGDILGLITDGVFEYANPSEEQFGEERMAQIVGRLQAEPMADLAHGLLDGVRQFGGSAPQADDITIVLARRLPLDTGPS